MISNSEEEGILNKKTKQESKQKSQNISQRH